MAKRLQNRIAESRMALPWTALACAVVWVLVNVITYGSHPAGWITLLFMALATIAMAVMNNIHALIRIYSRMVSCSFMVMMTMMPFLFHRYDIAFLQLSFIIFLLLLLLSYQLRKAPGIVFYAFVALSVGSLSFAPLLWLVPVVWLLMATNIMSLSIRTFFASILGLCLPYWFVVGWCFYAGHVSWVTTHFAHILPSFPANGYAHLGVSWLVSFATVSFLGLVGSIHFVRNNYLDKIRTRLIYEMFIVIEAVFFAAALFFPEWSDALLALIIVMVSPLLGHYVALTHTRWSNISCGLLLVAVILTLLFNLWK